MTNTQIGTSNSRMFRRIGWRVGVVVVVAVALSTAVVSSALAKYEATDGVQSGIEAGSTLGVMDDRKRGCKATSRDGNIIERRSRRHFPHSYAGLYFDGPRLRVGYNSRQAHRVRKARTLRSLDCPSRIAPFPYEPIHSMRHLDGLLQRILDGVMANSAYDGLMIGTGIEVERNVVLVETEDVALARQTLTRLYGSGSGIRVRFGERPVAL